MYQPQRSVFGSLGKEQFKKNIEQKQKEGFILEDWTVKDNWYVAKMVRFNDWKILLNKKKGE